VSADAQSKPTKPAPCPGTLIGSNTQFQIYSLVLRFSKTKGKVGAGASNKPFKTTP